MPVLMSAILTGIIVGVMLILLAASDASAYVCYIILIIVLSNIMPRWNPWATFQKYYTLYEIFVCLSLAQNQFQKCFSSSDLQRSCLPAWWPSSSSWAPLRTPSASRRMWNTCHVTACLRDSTCPAWNLSCILNRKSC